MLLQNSTAVARGRFPPRLPPPLRGNQIIVDHYSLHTFRHCWASFSARYDPLIVTTRKSLRYQGVKSNSPGKSYYICIQDAFYGL